MLIKKTVEGEKTVRLCNYMDVYKNEYITSSLPFMWATARNSEITKFLLKKGDVIITKDSEKPDDIAVPAYVIDSFEYLVCGYHLALIRPNQRYVLGSFLSKSIQLDFYRNYFYKLANGSTRFGLTTDSIHGVTLRLPSIREQKKIAEILTSVDRVIELTEREINKLKDLKKGIMQELLTKGIGHTKFKDSPVGKIPEGWEVKKLGMISEKIQDGTHFSPQSKTGPYKYITSKNIRYGYVDLSSISYISQEDHNLIYKRCDVKLGDVLFTKDGANTGNAALNPIAEPFSLLSSVAFIRCDEDIIHNYFILYFLLSPIFQKFIRDSMTGNAITRITLSTLKNFKINLPPYSEQVKIANVLNSLDHNLKMNKEKLIKLENIKKGLMQDLLTGKVRVKV